MSYKGIYTPKNTSKYIGDFTNVVYRSLWERKAFKFMDEHPGILKWGSEEIPIPYISPLDNRQHKYFVDLVCKLKDKENKIRVLAIEIKPKRQTVPPIPKSRQTKRYLRESAVFAINQAKWEAATIFCKQRGWEFHIWTEDTLKVF